MNFPTTCLRTSLPRDCCTLCTQANVANSYRRKKQRLTCKPKKSNIAVVALEETPEPRRSARTNDIVDAATASPNTAAPIRAAGLSLTAADITALAPKAARAMAVIKNGKCVRPSRSKTETLKRLVTKCATGELMHKRVVHAHVNECGYKGTLDHYGLAELPASESTFTRLLRTHRAEAEHVVPNAQSSGACNSVPPTTQFTPPTAPTHAHALLNLDTMPRPTVDASRPGNLDGSGCRSGHDRREMLHRDDDESLCMWINMMARSMRPPTMDHFKQNASARTAHCVCVCIMLVVCMCMVVAW